jgi:voltage-gated potassium channel
MIRNILHWFSLFFQQLKQERFTRARVHDILVETTSEHDRVSRFVDYFLITLIVLNVVAVMVDSVAGLADAYQTELFWFEAFSVLVFGIEYLARVWVAMEAERFGKSGPFWGRIRYIFTPMALTDLIAIIPFFIVLSGTTMFDLRFLRVLRLRRAFKLTRYSPDMSVVLGVVRDEIRPLMAVGFILLLLVIMSSSMIFVMEGAETGPFSSIPGSMAWALHHLTTIGNAGVVPTSAAGQAFGSFISILGVLYIALITGLFASGFTNARHKRAASLRRFIKIQLLTQNGLTETAEAAIDRQRRHLGFTAADSLEVINEVLEEQAANDLDALRALGGRDQRMLKDDV